MKRHKTSYPGVFYRQAERLQGPGKELVYYIVFKKGGKVFEKKVGRQFVDGMTPSRAARIRGQWMGGDKPQNLLGKVKAIARGPQADLLHKLIDLLYERETEESL